MRHSEVDRIKIFICNLTENVADQVLADFDAFGAEITWVSKVIPSLVALETYKTKKELEQFFLIETVNEDTEGKFYY